MCNNFGYVVMLSAAHDILGADNSTEGQQVCFVLYYKYYKLNKKFHLYSRKKPSQKPEAKSSKKPWSQEWLIDTRAYPGFCSMERLEVFLLPQDGMLVHRRSLSCNLSGFPNNLLVPIYTPGWREAL